MIRAQNTSQPVADRKYFEKGLELQRYSRVRRVLVELATVSVVQSEFAMKQND
jgi:hypothetical protein